MKIQDRLGSEITKIQGKVGKGWQKFWPNSFSFQTLFFFPSWCPFFALLWSEGKGACSSLLYCRPTYWGFYRLPAVGLALSEPKSIFSIAGHVITWLFRNRCEMVFYRYTCILWKMSHCYREINICICRSTQCRCETVSPVTKCWFSNKMLIHADVWNVHLLLCDC